VQQQGWARGMSLWGLVNASLVGSYIHRSNMTGVNLQHQLFPSDWLDPPMVNPTLTNNVIDGTNTVLVNGNILEAAGILAVAQASNFQPMTTSPHQSITISGNFVADPAQSAIWVGNTTGVSVTGNYLLYPNNNVIPQFAYPPFAPLESQPIVVESSTNVTTSNNTIDPTSGRMWVTDTQYNELAAYAPGSVYRLNAHNIGTLPNQSVSLRDVSGVTTSVTIKNTATHSLDVQIPASAALGGAYFTLISGATKYFATLFLDSQDNIPTVNGCTYETSLSSESVPPGASLLPILVVTQAGCSYQVLATDAFVTPPPSSTGTAVISLGFAANTSVPRSTTIEIAGQQIKLTQLTPTVATSVLRDTFGSIHQSTYASSTLSNAGGAFASDPSGEQDLNGNISLPHGTTPTRSGLMSTVLPLPHGRDGDRAVALYKECRLSPWIPRERGGSHRGTTSTPTGYSATVLAADTVPGRRSAVPSRQTPWRLRAEMVQST
jgi:hypothetical protein